jgi:hypothetical protein
MAVPGREITELGRIHGGARKVTLDLHMRGNPYERSGGKTGGSWQLRDRAPWGVFHIQFDKRPIELLRLRHVHRGYSCGRTIDAVR